VIGLLTGVNTLAAVTGSMVTGFVLLPRLGLGLTSLAVTCVYGVTAVLAQQYGHRGWRRWLGCGACLAMIVGWFLLGGWNVQLVRLEPGQKLISFHDGSDATVAVVERSDGHRVLKVNHEYTLGSSAGADREVRQGRLPLMLHPNPRRIAFVGVATGMTVSAALDFPVERVVAVELLPGVADTLPLFNSSTRLSATCLFLGMRAPATFTAWSTIRQRENDWHPEGFSPNACLVINCRWKNCVSSQLA
jgi:spermidine synthase